MITILLAEDGTPFTATAGSDWRLLLSLRRLGVAVNLSGTTVTSSIWRGQGAAAVEVFPDVECEIVEDGEIVVRVEHEATGEADVIAGTYHADVKIEDGDGDVEHFGPYQFEVRRALT